MIIKGIAAFASVAVLSLVGAGYAKSDPPPLNTGSSHINSGGASGSSDGQPKNIPLVDTLPSGGKILFRAPWGKIENTPLKVQYEVKW